MSERLNVPVLKTGEGNTSGGSNPPLPAITFNQSHIQSIYTLPNRFLSKLLYH